MTASNEQTQKAENSVKISGIDYNLFRSNVEIESISKYNKDKWWKR